MRAVLLAAGVGSRLGARSAALPKCLTVIAGRPLLLHHLERLRDAGITDVTVVAGHLADAVVAAVGDRARVVVNDDYATTNSLVSLNTAAPWLRGDGFILQNADVLYAPALVKRFVAHPAPNACLVDAGREYHESEHRIATDGPRIHRYERGLTPDQSVGESAQLLKVGARDADAFLRRIAELAASDGATGFPLQAYDVLQAGSGLFAVFTGGLPWYEVDTPEDLARCRAALEPESAASTIREPGSAPPMHRFAWLVELLRDRVLPWRLRWLPAWCRSAVRQPLRAVQALPALYAGRLSPSAFDLQFEGARILADVLAVAAALGIEPVLLWGTLLGHVRDGGFIRGDHDIDLGVLASDAPALPALRDALVGRGYALRIDNANKLSVIPRGLSTLYVDVDVVWPVVDGWTICNSDVYPDRTLTYAFGTDVFASRHRIQFMGVTDVAVPGGPEAFLNAVYGDWRTPQPKLDYRYGPMNTEVHIHSGRSARPVPPPATHVH